MKRIYIIISLCIILINCTISTQRYISSKEYIFQDGIMLALTLDGEKITQYPEGKKYQVEINCENGKGKWLVEEWKLAVEEITGNVVCNIDFTSNPKSLINEVESKYTENINGYRYNGKNPDNYIWFNNEIWRIIGSIPTCLSASCGTDTTNLVKIIRDQTIGGIVFDAVASGYYTGPWGENSLYNLLNTHYYSSTEDGLNGQSHTGCYANYSSYAAYNSKPNCNYKSIGILSSGYYGNMVKNVYWNTGNVHPYGTPNGSYNQEKATQTIQGYIGLMNVSDYGYAASSDYYDSALATFNSNVGYGLLEITETNWLFDAGKLWTLNKNSQDASGALSILGQLGSTLTNISYGVRPVVYLDPSVYIISGDGTQSNPYQIAM